MLSSIFNEKTRFYMQCSVNLHALISLMVIHHTVHACFQGHFIVAYWHCLLALLAVIDLRISHEVYSRLAIFSHWNATSMSVHGGALLYGVGGPRWSHTIIMS